MSTERQAGALRQILSMVFACGLSVLIVLGWHVRNPCQCFVIGVLSYFVCAAFWGSR